MTWSAPSSDSSPRRFIPYFACILLAVGLGYLLAPRLAQTPTYLVMVFVGGSLATASIASALFAPHRAILVLLALMAFVVDVRFIVTDITTQAALNPQILLKYAVYGACLLVALALARKRPLGKPYLLLPLYTVIAFVSAAYAPSPLFSVAATVILVAQVALAYCAFSRVGDLLQPLDIWKAVLVALSAKMLISWSFVVFAPHLAWIAHDPTVAPLLRWSVPRFAGLSGPNTIGFNATVAFLIALCLRPHARSTLEKRLYLFIIFLASMTLLATQSRTAIAALIASLAAIFLFLRGPRLLVTLAATALLGSGLWQFFHSHLWAFITRGGSVRSLQTLEGRTSIWQSVLERIADSPILGYGYGSGRTVIARLNIPGTDRTYHSAHNMFFESMLNFGALGTIVLVLLLAMAVFTLVRSVRSQGGVLRADSFIPWSVFTALCVNGMAESSLAGVQTVQLFLFALVLSHIWVTTRSTSSTAVDTIPGQPTPLDPR